MTTGVARLSCRSLAAQAVAAGYRLRSLQAAAAAAPFVSQRSAAVARARRRCRRRRGQPAARASATADKPAARREKQRRARPGNLIGHGGPIKAVAVDAGGEARRSPARSTTP